MYTHTAHPNSTWPHLNLITSPVIKILSQDDHIKVEVRNQALICPCPFLLG